ncbi:MAG: hypothetical protein HC808_10125 [Candidatus Competibacteraceae bacterium]|nr:hypothetical protein [Candidatus Competibacteraceae bacterium]
MADFQEIEVNGEIIEFPASMSDAEIQSVLAKQFPAPEKTGDLSGTIYGGIPALLEALKRGPSTLAGVGELGAQLGTSALAQPVAGVEAVGSGVAGGVSEGPKGFGGFPGVPSFPIFDLFNNDRAASALGNRLDAMTFQPRTEVGQDISRRVGGAFGNLDLALDDIALGATGGSPGALPWQRRLRLVCRKYSGLRVPQACQGAAVILLAWMRRVRLGSCQICQRHKAPRSCFCEPPSIQARPRKCRCCQRQQASAAAGIH